MDFYYTPTACSQAAHILLHEAGLSFRGHPVDLSTHRTEEGSDYRQINPNSYVPALLLGDGTLLTENVALLDWIAGHGQTMIPAVDRGRTRHLQMLAFVSTELQKPFVRLFFTDSEDEKRYLRNVLPERFRWIGSKIEGTYVFGDQFTPSDAFVYVMLRWAAMAEIDIPPELHELAHHVERRDATRIVLSKEGVEPMYGAAR